MNFLSCTKTDCSIIIEGQGSPAGVNLGLSSSSRFTGAPNEPQLVLGVRPEDVRLMHSPTAEALELRYW